MQPVRVCGIVFPSGVNTRELETPQCRFLRTFILTCLLQQLVSAHKILDLSYMYIFTNQFKSRACNFLAIKYYTVTLQQVN